MGGLTVAGAAHKESRKGWATPAAIRNRFWFRVAKIAHANTYEGLCRRIGCLELRTPER